MDLSHASIDELYVQLGLDLDVDGFGGDDARRLAAIARTWMSANATELRLRICPFREQFADRSVDIAAVADALDSFVGRPAGLTVAAIILKIGLEKFCRQR